MCHMELLHHFCTETFKTFGVDIIKAERTNKLCVKMAISKPYLMCEILSFAALQLGSLRPSQRYRYKTVMVELQTNGLTRRNQEPLDNLTEENCVALYLYSSMMATHAFCQAINFDGVCLIDFVEKFSLSIEIQRGAQVFAQVYGSQIGRTEIQTIHKDWLALTQNTAITWYECEELYSFISSSSTSNGPEQPTMDESTKRTYELAVYHLQWVFDAKRTESRLKLGTCIILGWPILVPPEYWQLFRQMESIALIIFAHYAVLLLQNSDLWFLGDVGQMLIKAITHYLGEKWEKWMVWPKQFLVEGI